MARLINFISLAGFLFSAASFAATAVTVDLNPEKSPVGFTAVGHPSALKIKGEGSKATGQLKGSGDSLEGEITANLDQFQTGIGLRDTHMKEKYLETGKPGFSSAVLKITSFKLPKNFFQKTSETTGQEFTGKLRLHGVEKDVKGTVSANYRAEQNDLAGIASFKVVLSDYGINVPKFSGITVAEDVSIEVQYAGNVKKVTVK
jgi:polyisoprenoid-binding protein YceI